MNRFSRDFDDINQITDLQLFSAIIFPASEPEVIVREENFEKSFKTSQKLTLLLFSKLNKDPDL